MNTFLSSIRVALLVVILFVTTCCVVGGEDPTQSTTVSTTELSDDDAAPVATSSQCKSWVLVTGGTGRTGLVAIQQLLSDRKEGFCVRVLTRNVTKAQGLLKGYDTSAAGGGDFTRLDFVSADLGNAQDIAKSFEGISVQHILYAAGGEQADWNAVNRVGLWNMAEQAVQHKVESMVVISAAWVTKPYSIAGLLFNWLYNSRPMALHLQGELLMQRAVMNAAAAAKGHSMNYVIIRAGRLVSDEEYDAVPENPKGISMAQGDSYLFLGPAGQPGMSTSQLGKAIVGAMHVQGKYTVEMTCGDLDPLSSGNAYTSMEQDDVAYLKKMFENPAWEQDIMNLQEQAVRNLQAATVAIVIGELSLIWKFGVLWGIAYATGINIALQQVYYHVVSNISV